MSRTLRRCCATAGLLALLAALPSAARGDGTPPEDEPAPGPGRELFVARCSVCHSTDYVSMHAPFGTRALWEASVAKMRNAFKAPISDEEARAIVEHLVEAYGPDAVPARGSAAPPASADDRK